MKFIMKQKDSKKKMKNIFDVALIGHIAKDEIVIKGERKTAVGGAVYYGAFPLSKMGLKVAVITKVAEKDKNLTLPLTNAGIKVFLTKNTNNKTTGIENIYLDESMERRKCRPIAFAGEFKIDEIPDIEAKVWHIGALMKGEIGLELIKFLSQKGKISLDVQGFVRVSRNLYPTQNITTNLSDIAEKIEIQSEPELLYEDWLEKYEILPYIYYLKADAAEAEILTNTKDIKESAIKFSKWGCKEIMITHTGGIQIYADGKFYNYPFTAKEIKGRTGRGDTCISSYIGRRLSHNPDESCKFAASLCSIKLEAEGPFAGTIEEVEERIRN